MQQQIKSLVQNSNNDVYELNAQMIQLEVVQSAIAQLMERIDEITHNEWHKDRGMAYLSILEIEKTVRLIDLGFYPLYTRMRESVNSLEKSSNKVFEMVVSGGNNQETFEEQRRIPKENKMIK